MAARRCPKCKRKWPPGVEFRLCRVCLVGTNWVDSGLPMSNQERDHTLALLSSLDAELEDARLLSKQRGPCWSIVDCLLELADHK